MEPATPGDADLVAGSRWEPDLFIAIYDRYFIDIYRYVAGRLGRQVADDITAETFLTAFRRRDRFDAARGAVRPWLYGIATKLVAEHRRQETRRLRAFARTGHERAADSHENQVLTRVSAEAVQPELARALAGLSKEERDVVLLVALAEFSHEEVAQALGIPYGTVGSRLSRARRKVRAVLNRPDEEGNFDG